MVFLRQSEKFMPLPPPPRRQTFRKNFLGRLKKISCKGKKNSCKQFGDEKKFVHRKIAQPPPQISNGPSLRVRPLGPDTQVRFTAFHITFP